MSDLNYEKENNSMNCNKKKSYDKSYTDSDIDSDTDSNIGSDYFEEFDESDDDGLNDLNISKDDLKFVDLGTKDMSRHYYHKKNNCIYSKTFAENYIHSDESVENNKWCKFEGSRQEKLMKYFEEKKSNGYFKDDKSIKNKK